MSAALCWSKLSNIDSRLDRTLVVWCIVLLVLTALPALTLSISPLRLACRLMCVSLILKVMWWIG